MNSVRISWGAVFAALGLAALGLHVLSGFADPSGGIVREGTYHGLLFGSGIACLVHAVRIPGGRLPWALVGIAIVLWAGGDLYWTLALADDAAPPYPSLADAGWLAMYPLMYVAVLLLLRQAIGRVPGTMWLDGVVGALAFTAIAIAFVFEPILTAAHEGTTAEIATNLAYPVGDLLLLGLVVLVCSIHGWRPGRRWGFFAAALAATALADAIYLYQISMGTYETSAILLSLWPLSSLLFAIAAWQPTPPARDIVHEGWAAIAMPTLFALGSVTLLVYDHFSRMSGLAIVLAGGALALAALRAGLTFREYLAVLSRTRGEAKTDPLTGLANRRALTNELLRRLTFEANRPFGLALFDLDGFKGYNDAYGHVAGDDLLKRLAGQLQDTLPPTATAYRLGGDEFCALIWLDAEGDFNSAVQELNESLQERGDGFAVASSVGTVLVPEESTDVRLILMLADRRMYSDKSRKRGSAGSQTRDVLLSLLREREPDLDRHMEEVAVLSRRVGRELKLDSEGLDEIVRAAELHDIGKLALPDSIVKKPGPLTDSEWQFMHSHTIIGERILSSAPALLPVANIVRSSHERWDGSGYPDGLRGEAIPLGARIVFVCDAFNAMVSERPYAGSRGADAALAEIKRCAGSQFDPAVVRAFAATLARLSSVPSGNTLEHARAG